MPQNTDTDEARLSFSLVSTSSQTIVPCVRCLLCTQLFSSKLQCIDAALLLLQQPSALPTPVKIVDVPMQGPRGNQRGRKASLHSFPMQKSFIPCWDRLVQHLLGLCSSFHNVEREFQLEQSAKKFSAAINTMRIEAPVELAHGVSGTTGRPNVARGAKGLRQKLCEFSGENFTL